MSDLFAIRATAKWMLTGVRATPVGVAFVLACSGCAPDPVPKPKIAEACCDINPAAICEAGLLGLGVTREEIKIAYGPDGPACPSAAMSETRLSEISALWEAAGCLKVAPNNLLAKLDSGACQGS